MTIFWLGNENSNQQQHNMLTYVLWFCQNMNITLKMLDSSRSWIYAMQFLGFLGCARLEDQMNV